MEKMHNEELHNLYSSPNIVRMIKSRMVRWARHVARMEELRYSYKVLVKKTETKRPFRKTVRRWQGSIKMDLKKVGWEGVD
jgi:hypothetical protein